MTKSLVIINPTAGGGRGMVVWQEVEHYLRQQLGDVSTVITRSPDEVLNCLKQASEEGATRVISIGGDGTNNSIVNAIMAHNQAHPSQPLSFGSIPAGTGRDWARGAGTPLDPRQAIDWIANTRLRPIDVGLATLDGVPRYFLNISSAGISNDVVQRVENAPKGGKLTFFKAIVSSLIYYKAQPVKISLDGESWFEDDVLIVAIANGRYFGQGLFVAPSASVDDGAFDVVVARGMPFLRTLQLLMQMYSGSHISNSRVKLKRAKEVRVVSQSEQPIGLDLDGEGTQAREISYRILPNALNTHI